MPSEFILSTKPLRLVFNWAYLQTLYSIKKDDTTFNMFQILLALNITKNPKRLFQFLLDSYQFRLGATNGENIHSKVPKNFSQNECQV